MAPLELTTLPRRDHAHSDHANLENDAYVDPPPLHPYLEGMQEER